MKKILLLDNYDSFTYNLVQYIEELCGYAIDVVRNDQLTVQEVDAYDVIFLSPGPGVPQDAGILVPLIQAYSGKKPIFGVCLGLQAMAIAFGGEIINLSRVFHGVATAVEVVGEMDELFTNIDSPFDAGRYHSWVATKETMPDCFRITAIDTEEGQIMAISHKNHLTKAVQFHPESILTPSGKQMIKNFLVEAGVITNRENIPVTPD